MMQRLMGLVCLGALLLGNVGCVVALGNRGSVKAPGCSKQAVTVDGQIYILDVDSHVLRRLDPAAMAEAEVVYEKATETTIIEASSD